MNIHLLSFLFDVLSWVVVGMAVGYLVRKTERNSIYTYPLYISMALLIGIFSTMQHALPEYGFATRSFIEVCIGTMLVAYGVNQTFRRSILG